MAKSIRRPQGVAAVVEGLVRPVIEGMGLTLWDVRFEKEGADWRLLVLIDRDGLMDTDTCEAASRAIDPVLDAADPIPQSYLLEVGSPGLGRKLTREEHFEAVKGQKIAAKLYSPLPDGQKEVAGILRGYNGQAVQIETEDGLLEIEPDRAGSFRLCDDEDLFG